jgi:putative DNA primase/helicase
MRARKTAWSISMNLVKLAAKLGGKTNGPWINIRGPGHSKDDLSLGIRFDPNAPGGFYAHSFADDDELVCREYVKEKLKDLSKSGQLTLEVDDKVPGPANTKSTTFALDLWAEAQPIKGTLAARYLEARGCAPTSGALSPQNLGFHPACPFSTFVFPAVVSLIREVITGEPVGIHRTAVSDDGTSKRVMPSGLQSKMMLGRALGAAIQFHAAGSALGLAEGIETALSAETIFKVPVWAATSAGGISSFPVIHGISRLVVFADNDDAGLSAAQACGCRYSRAGIEVEIRYPPVPGSDWNDFLQKE